MTNTKSWLIQTALTSSLVIASTAGALLPLSAQAIERTPRLPSVEINLDALDELRQNHYQSAPAYTAPVYSPPASATTRFAPSQNPVTDRARRTPAYAAPVHSAPVAPTPPAAPAPTHQTYSAPKLAPSLPPKTMQKVPETPKAPAPVAVSEPVTSPKEPTWLQPLPEPKEPAVMAPAKDPAPTPPAPVAPPAPALALTSEPLPVPPAASAEPPMAPLPDMAMPEFDLPDMDIPSADMPSMEMPELDLPPLAEPSKEPEKKKEEKRAAEPEEKPVELPPLSDLALPGLEPLPEPTAPAPSIDVRATDVSSDSAALKIPESEKHIADETDAATLSDILTNPKKSVDDLPSPDLTPFAPETSDEDTEMPTLPSLGEIGDTVPSVPTSPTMIELEAAPAEIPAFGSEDETLTPLPDINALPAPSIKPEEEESFFSRMKKKASGTVEGFFKDEEESSEIDIIAPVSDEDDSNSIPSVAPPPVGDLPDISTLGDMPPLSEDAPTSAALPNELPPLDLPKIPTVAVDGEAFEVPKLPDDTGSNLPPLPSIGALSHSDDSNNEISTDLSFLQDKGETSLDNLAPLPDLDDDASDDMTAEQAGSEPDLRILFEGTETSIPPSMEPDLLALSGTLLNQPDKRVTITAYAGKKGRQTSVARRVSLSRALSIRSYLIERGVDNLRINVKAMGGKFDAGESDRADIRIEG